MTSVRLRSTSIASSLPPGGRVTRRRDLRSHSMYWWAMPVLAEPISKRSAQPATPRRAIYVGSGPVLQAPRSFRIYGLQEEPADVVAETHPSRRQWRCVVVRRSRDVSFVQTTS